MKKAKSDPSGDYRSQFLEFVSRQKSRRRTLGDFRAKWSEYETSKVRNVVQGYRDLVMSIPGVNGLSYGPTVVHEASPGDFEITIHVEPVLYQRVKSDPRIPKEMGGYLVRIVPSEFRLCDCLSMNNARYATLTPGVNVGPYNGCGSLGVFVWYVNQSYEASLINRFFLSSWHVLTASGTLYQAAIFQPGGPGYKQSPIGFVWDAPSPRSVKDAFEVGIVKLDYPDPDYARLESPGHQILEHTYLPFQYQTLFMLGAGEKSIEGSVSYWAAGFCRARMDAAVIWVNDSSAMSLYDQLIILPFDVNDKIAVEGDSGAVWCDEYGVPIAINVGYYESQDLRLAIASPLVVVFETLGLTNIPPAPPPTTPLPPSPCIVASVLNTSASISHLATLVYPLLNDSPFEPLYHDFRFREKHHDELFQTIFTDLEMREELRYLAEELLIKHVILIGEGAEEIKASTKLPEDLLARADGFVNRCIQRMSPRPGHQLQQLNVQIQSLSGMSLKDIEVYLRSGKKYRPDYEEAKE